MPRQKLGEQTKLYRKAQRKAERKNAKVRAAAGPGDGGDGRAAGGAGAAAGGSRGAVVEAVGGSGMKRAPWTPEEVARLNEWQRDGWGHPYTCGSGRRTDKDHLDGEGVLVATPDGWVCPYCDYRQDWAHGGEP